MRPRPKAAAGVRAADASRSSNSSNTASDSVSERCASGRHAQADRRAADWLADVPAIRWPVNQVARCALQGNYSIEEVLIIHAVPDFLPVFIRKIYPARAAASCALR